VGRGALTLTHGRTRNTHTHRSAHAHPPLAAGGGLAPCVVARGAQEGGGGTEHVGLRAAEARGEPPAAAPAYVRACVRACVREQRKAPDEHADHVCWARLQKPLSPDKPHYTPDTSLPRVRRHTLTGSPACGSPAPARACPRPTSPPLWPWAPRSPRGTQAVGAEGHPCQASERAWGGEGACVSGCSWLRVSECVCLWCCVLLPYRNPRPGNRVDLRGLGLPLLCRIQV
jgi:hypothetical protein